MNSPLSAPWEPPLDSKAFTSTKILFTIMSISLGNKVINTNTNTNTSTNRGGSKGVKGCTGEKIELSADAALQNIELAALVRRACVESFAPAPPPDLNIPQHQVVVHHADPPSQPKTISGKGFRVHTVGQRSQKKWGTRTREYTVILYSIQAMVRKRCQFSTIGNISSPCLRHR